MGGRPPTPTALKKLRGTCRPHREIANEVESQSRIRMPKSMTDMVKTK